MRAMRVVVVLVVLAVVAVGVLAAVGLASGDGGGAHKGDTRPSLAPTPTPQPGSTEPPEDALAQFYGQTLDWRICPSGKDECATLSVPLDYKQPEGETIQLAVLKVPAK